MTVSNVLRGREGEASPETRERVLRAVRSLGYVPVTPPSRQGTHIPTRIIGLFYEAVKLDEYWGFQTSLGLHEGGIAHNYDLLTMLRTRSGEAMGEEELRFLDRRSDGFIFLAPTGQGGVLRTLVKHDIPVVTAFTNENIKGVSSVTLDNEKAMAMAVEYLLEFGHRKLAFLGGPVQRTDFRERFQGFKLATEAAGQRSHIFDAATNGWVEMHEWAEKVLQLILQDKITAVACATDYTALDLINLARKKGLQAPRDFSIIGMDDIPASATRGLTTIRYSSSEIGRRAVESIAYRLAGDKASQCNFVVPVELKIRKSVAPPQRS